MPIVDQYAVFGSPIKHSKSPLIHRLFAEQTRQELEYYSQDVDAEHFREAVATFFVNTGKGLNCTLPLKELAWQIADDRTARADLGRAVNTLVLHKDGSIMGDNTDGCGLIRDLTINHGVVLNNATLLVLGAGGATKGILGPLLEQMPQKIMVVNRTRQKAIEVADSFAHIGNIQGCGFDELTEDRFDLIINATSASLSGDLPPLNAGLLSKEGICYDLAYANDPTAFVRWGWQQGAKKSVDGVGMLVEQAAEAFFLWRNIRPQTQPIIDRLKAARNF